MRCPKILQLAFLGTQSLNPGLDPTADSFMKLGNAQVAT